jgi:hypothetical protein
MEGQARPHHSFPGFPRLPQVTILPQVKGNATVHGIIHILALCFTYDLDRIMDVPQTIRKWPESYCSQYRIMNGPHYF